VAYFAPIDSKFICSTDSKRWLRKDRLAYLQLAWRMWYIIFRRFGGHIEEDAQALGRIPVLIPGHPE